MKKTLKTITSGFLLLLASCASTDPNAPVDDDYNTSFYWSEYKSTALNLLRTADMDNKYSDVYKKEDIDEIRDRNTTLGNLFNNIANLAVFNVGMMAYSVSENDDDKDPKYGWVTYVTFIPVKNDDLSLTEQLSIRQAAVANVEKTLMAIGSEQSKFLARPKKNNRVTYRTEINGPACELTKSSYADSGFLPCSMTIKPTIIKVIATDELPGYMSKDIQTSYVAVVNFNLTDPLVAVAMAKNIQGNDFIAFPDKAGHYGFNFVTTTPFVVQNNNIHSFFKPSKNILPYQNNELAIGVYFKKTKRVFSMPIVTGDVVSTIKEGSVKK